MVTAPDMWYIWTVKPGKIEIVESFIEGKIVEVVSILCPSITKQKTLKSGKVKKKTTSIYGGYIFLKYGDEKDSSSVYHKLKSNPFIVSYVGACTEKELISVYKVQSDSTGG
jgi:transcription antitermination factor NusG